MPRQTKIVTAFLQDWPDVSAKEEWDGLLLGNGASCAIWRKFRYASLYETAKSPMIEAPLTERHQRIFEKLQTTNFEVVLSSLLTSRVVCASVGHSTSEIASLYEEIQKSLVGAVHHVHIPWNRVSTAILKEIGSAIREFGWIYSTNYDLLLYWSIMEQAKSWRAKDYFWGTENPRFKLEETHRFDDGRAFVLYLHGGLHLYRESHGETVKRTASEDLNLLDLFGTPLEGAVPLLVTEGSSQEKMRSIHRSDYLSYAYSRLVHHQKPLVVFGHALGDSDQHLIDAIRSWDTVTLAVSVQPSSDDDVIERKLAIRRTFPHARIYYFNSETHPLGRPELRISDE